MEKTYTCVYCGKTFIDYGNNPDTWDGTNWNDTDRCCDDCNLKVVIPGRIIAMRANKKKNK